MSEKPKWHKLTEEFRACAEKYDIVLEENKTYEISTNYAKILDQAIAEAAKLIRDSISPTWIDDPSIEDVIAEKLLEELATQDKIFFMPFKEQEVAIREVTQIERNKPKF